MHASKLVLSRWLNFGVLCSAFYELDAGAVCEGYKQGKIVPAYTYDSPLSDDQLEMMEQTGFNLKVCGQEAVTEAERRLLRSLRSGEDGNPAAAAAGK